MIPLEGIIEFLDWQTGFYDGEAKAALVSASNAIYDHIHKDDPEL